MHMAAKAITNRLIKKLNTFTAKDTWFKYKDAYFTKLDDEPVTVEQYVDGDFIKYINNDGSIGVTASPGKKFMYEKAEALVHFSYQESNGKLLLVDLQGSGYNLLGPVTACPNFTVIFSHRIEMNF